MLQAKVIHQLEMLCTAEEYVPIFKSFNYKLTYFVRFSDIKIRSGEKQVLCMLSRPSLRLSDISHQIYNKLRTHDDIRYKPNKIEKSADKISVIIQV